MHEANSIQVINCINLYFDYSVETCLEKYESNLKKVGLQDIDSTLPTLRNLGEMYLIDSDLI